MEEWTLPEAYRRESTFLSEYIDRLLYVDDEMRMKCFIECIQLRDDLPLLPNEVIEIIEKHAQQPFGGAFTHEIHVQWNEIHLEELGEFAGIARNAPAAPAAPAA